jgi:hypothetical protein
VASDETGELRTARRSLDSLTSKEGEGKSLDVSRKSSVIHSRPGSVAPP